ncbi:MAG: hypothetical protein EZS28_037636, partial [Streblomastix strix]
MLKPGGVLILLEALSGCKRLDVVFGLTKGWWALKDTNLRRHPLLTPDKWNKVLTDSGYADVKIFYNWNENKQETNKAEGRMGVIDAQTPSITLDEEQNAKQKAKQLQKDLTEKLLQTSPLSTSVVFVEEEGICGNVLISRLLREGHSVIGVWNNYQNGFDKINNETGLQQLINISNQKAQKTQFEQTIVNEGDVLFEEEIKLLSQRFIAITIESPFSSKDEYNQKWDSIDKVGLPSVISIINLWSLDIPHVRKTQQDVERSFAINTFHLYILFILLKM